MRTELPKPLFSIEASTIVLALFGTAMVFAGFFYPGRQAAVATAFIVAGAAMVAVGIFAPRMRELEIGPSGLKTKMRDLAPPKLILDIHDETLDRFAYMVSGDVVHAREMVEEALARAKRHLPGPQRNLLVLRTLIELLDTVRERHWLRGGGARESTAHGSKVPALTSPDAVRALQELPFTQRISFLLHADWQLKIDEIAVVVQRSSEAVHADISRAREALRPYVGIQAGVADAQ